MINNILQKNNSAQQNLLNSTNQNQVVMGLHNALIHGVDADDMKQRLNGIHAALWYKTGLNEKTRHNLLTSTIHGNDGGFAPIDKDNVSEFLTNLAHMGQMNEMGALVARENVFREVGKKRTANNQPDGMAASYIANADASVSDLVQQISGKVFEQSFTAHPTNMNDLIAMKAQRDVMDAIDKMRHANPTSEINSRGKNDADTKLREAVGKYVETTTTPREKYLPEQDTNLNTADETDNMLYFLKRAYANVGDVYEDFDKALSAKAAERGEAYKPEELKLKYVFSSWGSSGDKDGNNKVNAYTLLQSLAQHMEVALGEYNANLHNIGYLPPELMDWKAKIDRVHTQAVSIKSKLAELQDQWGAMPPEEADALFDQYSSALKALVNGGDKEKNIYGVQMKEFATALGNAISAEIPEGLSEDEHKEAEDSKQQVLMLKRRYDIFGATMGRIEFRETANNFCKVMNYLLDGEYGLPAEEMEKQGVSPEAMAAAETKKQEILSDLLRNPERISELVEAKRATFEREGSGIGYTNTDQMVNHTLKRLQLAAQFPDAFVNQVLAECQDASNVLEAQVLMKAAKTKTGEEPVLGIQPLFEDPDILLKVGGIMDNLFSNEFYQQHLTDFAKAHPRDVVDGKATQVVQFAHSDNSRRGGTPASAAAIYIAHKAYRDVCKKHGIEAREFQGGSMSDPFRSGVRSMVGMINDYDMYDFTKVTIQNGDLLNLYNYDPSAKRFMEGILVYQAQHKQHLKSQVESIDKMALEVALGCKEFYRENHFRNDKIGLLFPLILSNSNEIQSGNVGSRGQRNDASNTQKAGPKPFETISVDGFEGAQPYMNPNEVRTITYSELLQHHLICPTWLSVAHMKTNMSDYVDAHFDELMKEPKIESLLNKSMVDDKDVEAKKSYLKQSPQMWKMMRDHSPAFKKIMDHAAFGLAMTNFKTLHETLQTKMKDYPAAAEYLKGMEREYIDAAQLIEMSFSGLSTTVKPVTKETPEPEVLERTDQVQKMATNLLPHLKSEIETKRGFLGFMQQMQEKLVSLFGAAADLPQGIARLLHAARDTMTHSRYLAADDLVYRQALKQMQPAVGAGK